MNWRVALLFSLSIVACDCGSGDGSVETVSVRQIWSAPEPFAAVHVRTYGTLRSFDAGTVNAYFALDDMGYRIGLQHVSNLEARPLVDQRVVVEGVVESASDSGIFVDVEQLDRTP